MDKALDTAVSLDDLDAAKICVSKGADPSRVIGKQEAYAAEKAARVADCPSEEDSDDASDDGIWRKDWSSEMESFLRSAMSHT